VTDLHDLVNQVAGQRGLGGVGVAVVRRGQPPLFACEGLADGASGRPIAPATVFRIASITKTMTAIGILQLRDEGRLDLDDPVNDYLQGLRIETAGEAAVTFRHLLTHTAGLGEMPKVLHFFRRGSWGAGEPGSAPLDLPTLYGGTLHTEVPAGTKWAYANHGFVVLGKLIEDVSGRTLPEYMDDRLFSPLGMASTAYGRTEPIGAQLARGHHWLFGRFRTVRDYDLTLLGAGAVLSSLSDMATYAGWLLDGGSHVLAPSTLAEMTRPQFSLAPGLPAIGLAFSLGRCGEHAVFGHDGNMVDFASVVLVAPDAGVGVVVLTNTATVLGANQLAAAALRHELAVPDPVASLTASAVLDPPQRWARRVGSYAPAPGFLTNVRSWQMLGGEVQVVVRRRRLVLRAALSPVRTLRRGAILTRTDPADPSRYAFVHDGQVVPVVFGDAPATRKRRVIIGRPVNAVLYRRSAVRSTRFLLRMLGACALALLAVRLRRCRPVR